MKLCWLILFKDFLGLFVMTICAIIPLTICILNILFMKQNILGHSIHAMDNGEGVYIPIRDAEEPWLRIFDKPLPCFGCGVGWISFLLGFACPLIWYFTTILYLGKHYHKDPRERSGLAACAIAATICMVALAA